MAFHKVTEPGGNAVGIAGSLRKEQSQCLRAVAGAYRATPVRSLETETFVPPLDLYLNGRVALFEGRIEESGMAQLIRDSCTTIARKLRNRRRHYTMHDAANAHQQDNREGKAVASHRPLKHRPKDDTDNHCERVEGTVAERGWPIKGQASRPCWGTGRWTTGKRTSKAAWRTSKSGKLPPHPDENREDRTPSLPVRTPAAGVEMSSEANERYQWRWHTAILATD